MIAAGAVWTTGLPTVAEPIPSCNYWYDYAGQWTAVSSNFYHPDAGSGCIIDGAYYGWVGINGQIQSPSHYPNLCQPPQPHCNNDQANHSVGYLEMAFDYPSNGWIQVGWIAGCINLGTSQQACSGLSTLSLYDESVDQATNPETIVSYSDGTYNFSTADIVNVEYYPSYYPGINCWIVSHNYNVRIRYLCSGGSTWNWQSGAPAVLSETCACDTTTGIQVEMPVTVYGYSNPNTNNALRIKGAAGYVPWTSNLSSYTTSWYDERYCPNSYCVSPSPAYYASLVYSNYEMQAYGDTS